MKINYIIATWNGIRVKPIRNIYYYEQVLKNHLKILNNTPNSITQITIMKPHSGIVNSYYDVELTDKMVLIDCKNRFQSYGQWLEAVILFNDFDYYIFIEDDYVPAINNFDTKLIGLYKEDTYLCSLATILGGKMHCAISNGIISKNTINNILIKTNYANWLNNYAGNTWNKTNYQVAFSHYLLDNGIELIDYSNHYIVNYFQSDTNKIINYSHEKVISKEEIFTPIQKIIK